MRALIGTASHFCEVVVLQSRTVPNYCRANMIRQSRPDSGLDLEVKVLKIFEGVPSSLGRGLSAG
jgi:hypothetical protein